MVLFDLQLARALPSGVNAVEQLGLAGTAQIDIRKSDTDSESAKNRYGHVHQLTIIDSPDTGQIVAALATELKQAPIVACIPDHELLFYLADGTTHKLSYSCEGASFLRGDPWKGRDFWHRSGSTS